jgi:arsenate reductase (thioredoxin)
MTQKIKVAYICVHNSCHSQMTEAISKLMTGDDLEAYSLLQLLPVGNAVI